MEKINELLEAVRANYQLSSIKIVAKYGENPWIFQVSDDEKKYFLKVKKEEMVNRENVGIRYNIIEQIGKSEIRVPNIFRNAGGDIFFRFQNYIVELQEWIEFEPYNDTEIAFESTIDLLANMLSVLSDIEVSVSDKDEEKEWQYINDEDFNWELMDFLLNKYLPDEKEFIEKVGIYLDQHCEKYKKEIEKKNLQWIHADYNLKNIGYISQKAKVLVDFERLKIGNPIEDVALCFFELCIKDVEDNKIQYQATKFMDRLQKYQKVFFSQEALLFTICRRMLRHVYRGIERMNEGIEINETFYAVFLNGLKKAYQFLNSEFSENAIDLKTGERELFKLLIDISKDELSDIVLFKKWVLDKDKFDYLFKICCKHKIMSNLYYHLIHHNLFSKISKYYVILMNNCMSYAKEKQSLYYSEFEELNKRLKKHGFPYACIKGIGVSKRYYNTNPNLLRDFNDIDFLVCQKDVFLVEKVLKESGYMRGFFDYKTSEFVAAPRQEIIYWGLASHQVYPFSKPMPNFKYSPVNVFKIDVNFSIYFGGKIRDEIGAEQLLDNVEWVGEGDKAFPILAPEKEILQYCYNFYKDTVYKIKSNGLAFVLSNLRDIHYILEKRGVKPELLQQLLENTSIANNVYQVISDVYVCYGGKVASEIIKNKKIEISDVRKEIVIKQLVNC